MFGSIGFDFGAIQTDFTNLQESRILGNEKYLNKECFKFGKKAFAESSYRIMIGMGIGGNVSKSKRIVGGAFGLFA